MLINDSVHLPYIFFIFLFSEYSDDDDVNRKSQGIHHTNEGTGLTTRLCHLITIANPQNAGLHSDVIAMRRTTGKLVWKGRD